MSCIPSGKFALMSELCINAIKHQILLDKSLGPDALLAELWDNEEDAVYDNL